MRRAKPIILDFVINKMTFHSKPFTMKDIVNTAINEMPEVTGRFYDKKELRDGTLEVMIDHDEVWDNEYFVKRCWKIITRRASQGVKIKPEYFSEDKRKLLEQKMHQEWSKIFNKDTQRHLATHKIKYKAFDKNRTIFIKCKLCEDTPKYIYDTIQLRETKVIRDRIKKNVQRANDRHLMLGENFKPMAIQDGVKYLKGVEPKIIEKENELKEE